MKSILNQAQVMTQGEVWPNTPSLYPDNDLIITVIDNQEPAPDSVGDKYMPMDWKTFLATFQADMIWIEDTVSKMASEVHHGR